MLTSETATSQHENQQTYTELATILRENSQRIKELVDKIRQSGLVVHGIKNPEFATEVEKNGIRPVTPEGGYASYWNKGLYIFLDPTAGEMGKYLDSSYFRYSLSIEGNQAYMILAVSTVDQLPTVSETDKKKVDGVVTVNNQVTPEHLSLFILSTPIVDTSNNPYPRLQQEMIGVLENYLEKGCPTGIVQKISV